MKRKVTFWTEGGNPTGMGHVSRCVNLAVELGSRGVRSSFIVNGDDAVKARLEAEGFDYVVGAFEDGAPELAAPVVVIDTKKDLSAAVKELKSADKKVVVIENTTTEDADAVIMPSPVFDGAYDRHGVFAGAEFVIMGRNFITARKAGLPRRHTLPLKVLVTMGGADPNNLTELVVNALRDLAGIELTVVVGPAARPSRRLAALMKERSRSLNFVTGVTDLAPFMGRAHIAFTAVGTTVYELAYMGVPSVIIANYEDDGGYLKVFEALGICECLGFHKTVRGGEIVRAVRMFLNDPALWEAMSKSSLELTDGEGAGRIAQVIEQMSRFGSRLPAARPAGAAST